MKLSATVRIVVVVCATLIVLGVVAALVLTGSPVDAGALLTGAGVLLCGLLYGVGVAANGGSGPGLVLLVALAGVSAQGCGVSPACQVERTIVSALDAGVEASAEAVGPDGGEEWHAALAISRGATELGRAAVGACELARNEAGWQSWVGLGLEIALGLVGIIAGHGDNLGADGSVENQVEVPPELAQAIELLEGEERR